MSDSRFWRAVAVLAVAGMFYIGHGLHRGGEVPILTSQALANGVAVDRNSDGSGSYAITSSPDGKTVYYYGPKEFRQFFQWESYLGRLSAP